MHVTHSPFRLQKQNKNFWILHSQANRMVYNFCWFKFSFADCWTHQSLKIFSCSMCNFTNNFLNFAFFQYACLCELWGFSLRWTHIYIIGICNTKIASRQMIIWPGNDLITMIHLTECFLLPFTEASKQASLIRTLITMNP